MVVEARLGGHLELGPVAVHRLADAVEDRERGEEREPAECRSRSRGSLPVALPRVQRQRPAGQEEPGEQDHGQDGSPHQNPRPTKTATNTGASAVPNPRSALSTRTGGRPPADGTPR